MKLFKSIKRELKELIDYDEVLSEVKVHNSPIYVDNYSSCTADQDKPECSLIEELRLTQKELKELEDKNNLIKSNYGMNAYIYGVVIDKKDFKYEEDIIQIAIKNTKRKKELIKLEKELKQQLGIE